MSNKKIVAKGKEVTEDASAEDASAEDVSAEDASAEDASAEDAYVESLSEKEKVAYNIAVNFLKTSFDLERSLGFVEYVKKHYLREDN